ncbi:hypothetical protein ACFOUP_03665 [Belliella kenyensis]|uniref:TerB-C domain-containing protein n=1 Tax=Belliella kenyensis TaxID=1472724 RepID=A0ABV8EHC9_9BACT|nr:hypothetical protein [Belliella kenyensis]MCH7403717.1 hypothetical protein [Belliella kenyensis]MDN3603483.1 hypothetical protein [Belliella kenyensis]
MSVKINSKYLENYALEFSKKISEKYFSSKKYITGSEILNLTPSKQVNYFVIKSLFENWQIELEKLKSSPYFDYRDNHVHQALQDFMNILSRSIKIDRTNFEPLLMEAVAFSIILALDPITFYKSEFEKLEGHQVNQFLKENMKYFKWHETLVSNLVDRAGMSQDTAAYKKVLFNNYEVQKDQLQRPEELLDVLKEVLYLDYDILFERIEAKVEAAESSSNTPIDSPGQSVETSQSESKESFKEIQEGENLEKIEDSKPELEEDTDIKEEFATVEAPATTQAFKAVDPSKAIDPLQTWARFESEQYSIMKGTIHELSESVGINQRFMFTKELFDGNPDLMKHALKSIDQCDSFMEAVQLINERYVGELSWDKNSEPVDEFLQLIFRKFDQRG